MEEDQVTPIHWFVRGALSPGLDQVLVDTHVKRLCRAGQFEHAGEFLRGWVGR